MASARSFENQEQKSAAASESEWSKKVVIEHPVSSVELINGKQRIEVKVGNYGVFKITCLQKGDNVVAVRASVGEVIDWALRKEEGVVKLDGLHYFFAVRGGEGGNDEDVLNHGYMITGKGSVELDTVLKKYTAFSEEGYKVAASWMALAPNVDHYTGSVARMIAFGSGQLIGGILSCGDVTVNTLEMGNVLLNNLIMHNSEKADVSPEALRKMERVTSLTKMSENVATGIHSRVPRTRFLTTSIANSKQGKKLFSLLPVPGEELLLASLDALDDTCQAVQVAGRKVTMPMTSTRFVYNHGLSSLLTQVPLSLV